MSKVSQPLWIIWDGQKHPLYGICRPNTDKNGERIYWTLGAKQAERTVRGQEVTFVNQISDVSPPRTGPEVAARRVQDSTFTRLGPINKSLPPEYKIPRISERCTTIPQSVTIQEAPTIQDCNCQEEVSTPVVEEVVKTIQSGRGIEEEIFLQVHADFDIQDLDPGLGQDEEMKIQSGTEDHEERKPRSYYTETKPHLKVREVSALEDEERLREQRRRKRRAKIKWRQELDTKKTRLGDTTGRR